MTALDVTKYGYPLRTGYGITTDLAVLRTANQSGWSRQRRTYLHNASLITLSWQLRLAQAKELREWLQGQPDGQFFDCELLTGNDASVGNTITSLPIRRTTGITEQRIALTDQVVLTFSAETQEQTGYQELADAAANQGPIYYPEGFPLPAASNFSAGHGSRNVTTYALTYGMDTAMLADWLAFAGAAGTAWFWHPMISSNVLCGYELVRYTSAPSQQLVGPNAWAVGVAAESMPGYSVLELVMPPTGECTYDSAINYDDPVEEYDCGGVAPPTGDFVVPAGLLTVSSSVVGASPQTATVMLGFNRDGSVISSPASSPVWTAWHTAPETLPNAAISFNEVVEISTDGGATWRYSTPRPGGTWLSLKNQDVQVRLSKTSIYDDTGTLSFNADFRANQLPSPDTFIATASIQFSVALDVTNPDGVVDNAVFEDGYIIALGEGQTTNGVSAGVTFTNRGEVIGRSTGVVIGNWFEPVQTNAGQGLWIILTDSGGSVGQGKPTTGVRLSLATANTFEVYSAGAPGGTFARCYWSGSYHIYNAQTGGILLGSGTIYLESEASL